VDKGEFRTQEYVDIMNYNPKELEHSVSVTIYSSDESNKGFDGNNNDDNCTNDDGIEAPALGHNDYTNIKSVKGKIEVMRLGHPDYNNPHAQLAAYASLEAKIDTAIHKGAAGVIIINTHDEILEPDFKPIVKAPFRAVPIYFLHFPIALETRAVFKERYKEITLVMDQIASDHPHIHSIKIDESKVQRSMDASDDLREFPYHYDEATYLLFKKEIEELAPLRW
jgi:hypothetical protein